MTGYTGTHDTKGGAGPLAALSLAALGVVELGTEIEL
jgi:hypothetical protein